MNTPNQTLKNLCFSNPALRSLLQFDATGSTEIAELNSSNIHFSILYNKRDDNFLVHYRCHNSRPAWESSPEGYVRCGNFEEVLEALNEEIQEYHLNHGYSSRSFNHQKFLWLSLSPIHIVPAFRSGFSKELEQAIEQTPVYNVPSRFANHCDRWSSFLHRLAMSA